ncbi:MAG: RDD family protein [Alphaproteobacteria bacterium]|nr:RDD family protein [Alphaproteobacteria bacterium]OJV47636.1 MAG: hypothetical protein BGO28_07350 [Alphaproteobacteria bacterium 43-37]
MQYVGFFRRTLANFIDIFIITLVLFISVAFASNLKGYTFEATKGFIAYGMDNAIILLGYVEGFFVALFSGTSTLSLYWQEVTTIVPGDAFPSFKHLICQFILVLISLNLYHVVCEWTALQGSIGKFICRMEVIRIDGKKPRFFQVILRNVLKLFSSLILGFGHFWILFSRKKQGIHDYLTGTLVVAKGRLKDEDVYPRWY